MIKIDEKSLEDLIFETLEQRNGAEKLKQKGLILGLHDHAQVFRQVNLKEYGIADIIRVVIDGKWIRVQVIELKVVDFELAHLAQLGRYISGINHIESQFNLSNHYFTVDGILICSGYKSDDSIWIGEALSSQIHIYTTEYGLDGIKFDRILPAGWTKTRFKPELIDVSFFKQFHREAYVSKMISSTPDLPF